jgi:DnaJ-class molecular chaperone
MRLGKDVLESDLYAELGLLPDATASEIRVAYRHRVRASHPDLNQHDPDAAGRMTRLNVAAKVLLDPALRRAYDRAPRAASKSHQAPPPRDAAWFERAEQSADNDWAPPPAAPREQRASFGNFFGQLRGRDGQVSLQLKELIDSLTTTQQMGVAALLFALAIGLLVMARPQGMIDGTNQPTSVNIGSVYP